MNVDVFDAQGQVVRQVDLPEVVFGVEIKEHLLHEVVRYQLVQRRQGTAHTKTRSVVRGGGRKPWRQKGTGRARAGSRSSPLWRGGGTVFDVAQPKTRQVVELIQQFTREPKVLLVVGEPHETLALSARNIPKVKVLPVAGLNVYDMLNHTMVICAEEAIEKIVGRLTHGAASDH
jgi:large subunit ribosomal protein L4